MNGEQLKRAREMRGLTQAELADELVTQAAIARIEQNLFPPSRELVERLAKRLDFPVGFFYETSTFDFPHGSLLFRCLKGIKSKDKSQVVQVAWAGYKMYDFMAKHLKIGSIRFPKIAKKDSLSAPEILRNALGIEPEKPIKNLINKLERAGVVVISVPLDIHEHDGFSLWVEDRPVIVLSSGKSGDRQPRTVTHEAMHLANHYSFSGSLDEMEDDADALTNEFLLPESAMRSEITTPVTLSSLAELKPRWGVSIQSFVERSFELGITTANQRKYLWQQIGRNNWRTVEPLPIEPEKPRALQKMAELQYTENGRVNYFKLASDVNLPSDLVHKIMSGYEGYPETDVNNVVKFSPRLREIETEGSGIQNQAPDPSKVKAFSR